MGNKIKSVLFRILVFVLSTKLIWAQQEISYKSRPVSFPAFLSGVVKGNLGYIANQFNVSIAKAELKASQVFPDPEIALTYGYNEDRRLQMGQSFEAGLSYPVNTANRRGANIALARSNYELSEYLLDAFFQNLRADAALS